MALPAGSRLGRYAIVEQLGAGGMGIVYRARDERLQRDVAIKVLPPEVVGDETARRRFRKEALALAKLSHPNIAAVYDAGEEGDTSYLVMECVAGESLASRIERGPLAVAEALDVAVQIARGLGDAHEHGVVHRDLKPANVMITPKGQVKVLDFGLATLRTRVDGASTTLSAAELGIVGTPLYMSPEQVGGAGVDGRSDLWSLGVVLYESLTGRTPFHGATSWAVLHAVSEDQPQSVRSLRSDVPTAVDSLVSRALTKDVTSRYQTAGALASDASAALAAFTHPAESGAPRTRAVRSRIFVPAAVALLLVAGAASWLAVRIAHRRWARDKAIPEARALANADMPLAGFLKLRAAEASLPNDTSLVGFEKATTRSISITSTPTGADVAIQDYVAPDSAWHSLGTTPLQNVVVPKGYYRWRVSRPGHAASVTAPLLADHMSFQLDSAEAARPGMVRVGARGYRDYIAFLGWIGPVQLPAFDIGRFEVTNKEFQQFVDSGGYRDRQYWREKFDDHGHELSWDEASVRFRDRSGRPGPSTWEGGHYPEGHADYPVSGISWYEAAAYALFRGQSLPTMVQWHLAAPPDVGRLIGRVSNTSGDHVAAVGSFRGVGPFGTYDMAGNVREWTMTGNEDGARFILGGAWASAPYLYAESETLPPFDRSPTNGVRCVADYGPNPPETMQLVKMLTRDFSHFTPASDAVFRAYQVLYRYDHTPLNSRVERVVEQTADWRVEKISFETAYRHERMSAYLYIPTRVRPPYQTVIFFPSARVEGMLDSKNRGDVSFFNYVVQSGRAVMYPVYQNLYERRLFNEMPGAAQEMALTTERSKDVERSLDYLATRTDIDTSRVAYLGVSAGAAFGAIFATVAQERLRTAIFLDGGFFLGKAPEGADQADFVPRMKKPVLMVNGRYDGTFTYNEAQVPMFRMLGTPSADKKEIVLETAHDVTTARETLTRTVLTWLDKYLGRVE